MEGKTAGFLVALVVIAAFAVGVAFLGMNDLNAPRSEGILGAAVGSPPSGVVIITAMNQKELSQKYDIAPYGEEKKIMKKTDKGQIVASTQEFLLTPLDGSGVILRGTRTCVPSTSCGSACTENNCRGTSIGCGSCACRNSTEGCDRWGNPSCTCVDAESTPAPR